MKPVKNLVFAALLVFSIAFNTFGGDIDQPGAAAPPPPPRMSTTTDETIPEATTETEQTMLETADYSLFEALVALLSVY
jgi:hypothetical protein